MFIGFFQKKWLSIIPIIVFTGLFSGITHFNPDIESFVHAVVKDNSASSSILFILIGIFLTALGFPRQALCFLSGYVFNYIIGTAIALLISICSCFCSFICARLLGRTRILACFPKQVRYVNSFLKKKALTTIILVRLFPVGSNLLTNITAGISNIGTVIFIVGSTIGYIPQTIIFTLLGSGMQINQDFRIISSIILFLLPIILGTWIFFYHVDKKPSQYEGVKIQNSSL